MTRRAFLVHGVIRSVTKLTRERVRVAIPASALIRGERLGTNGGSSGRRVVVVGSGIRRRGYDERRNPNVVRENVGFRKQDRK